MAKAKGRKPAEDSELPDPSVWKWCKHPDCMKKARQLKGFGGETEHELMRNNSELCAVFLEDYCWEHLSRKAKDAYKEKIEAWIAKGHSLERANLQGADLREANLQRASFMGANMQEASLGGANLQEADLWRANMQKADLWEANLQEAGLWNANLQGAFLYGVLWDGALNLTWEQIKRAGEETVRDWSYARDAYRRLKNYFHQQGRYGDESQAYYREKLMAQRQAWKEKKLGKWFVLFLLNILAGYGEKLWRTVVGAFTTILIFSGIYWLAGKLVTNGGELITKFWHCLYFSVVTFATLGFGDISPALHSTGTQVAAVIEVILGYVFLGTLITIIARKFGR